MQMKALGVVSAALVLAASSAMAADMAAKAPLRAAPVAYAPSWTGCYVGGGGGYGLWNQDNTTYNVTTVPRTQVTGTTTAGGRGYFGTVQGGCDYQFGLGGFNLVIGAFGDYDWDSLKGNQDVSLLGAYGREKMSSQWSVGGRVGWVVTPNLLTYFSAGYTEAHFDSVTLLNNFAALGPIGAPLNPGLFIGSRNYQGYFIGAGDEYALNFLPGLFWKTEYRFSDLDTRTNSVRFVGTNALTGFQIDSHKFVHTVRSELVYRFNWGGPVAAKY
jgi:outer membrane immunogenic protein